MKIAGEEKEVVVTGIGPVSSVGIGKEEYWDALKAGRSGIRHISLFDTSELPCRIGGEIDDKLLDNGEFSKTPTSRGTSFVIKAARLALEDAGIAEDDFSSSTSGIYVGMSTTDMGIVEDEYASFQKYGSVGVESVVNSSPHAAASKVARALKCSGRVITVSTGCASGLLSIISGVESIKRGDCDVILAGGGDAPLTPFLIAGFYSAGLLSTSYNDHPSSASRPFDAKRDRGVLSEGAGMLLLESAERAHLRKAKIYGRIAGWGLSNAASPALKHLFVSSIYQALQKSQLQPEKLDYICANAPGDLVDKAEVKAIKNVFGSYAYNLPVSSIKSMIGYPVAGCGPLQVIAALQAIQENYVPPTINYEYPDPHCDLDFVPNRGRVARVNNALINLSSLGGNISSLVITNGNRW